MFDGKSSAGQTLEAAHVQVALLKSYSAGDREPWRPHAENVHFPVPVTLSEYKSPS